ncbi:hypothetical protein ABEV73_11920, partial [Geobacillus stearothermophilus]|uniref:hypothetical protein n=1 Tax=Geobacillus stearothermophilus TaxID=1422 RepID=UPI003D1A79E4
IINTRAKRAFFDQVPGKAPNGNAPFSAVVIQIKGDEKRRQQDAEGMKKRHKQRIPQFGYKWQIWYQPICLPLACSRGDDGPLLLDPKKCSGMLANPSE